MELDTSLSLLDQGLSAYHQRHVVALGVSLRAVEDSQVPAGSVLIVEGLDRLSRAEPPQAPAQLVNAGITVVTVSDGREYNSERLKAQPMDLVYSLLVMVRTHEESDTKSKRVKAADPPPVSGLDRRHVARADPRREGSALGTGGRRWWVRAGRRPRSGGASGHRYVQAGARRGPDRA